METSSYIQSLPLEMMDLILSMAAKANQEEGVRFTYGLSRDLTFGSDTSGSVNRYVRGPISEASARWDASRSIRNVCSTWGAWATRYNFDQLRERCLHDRERWADLPTCRTKYPLYEMIDSPRGVCISRDLQRGLVKTAGLLRTFPHVAGSVRRLWFDDFHAVETDDLIFSIITSCQQLVALTMPHTILQRCTTEDWMGLLGLESDTTKPLRSLEINAVRVQGRSKPVRDGTARTLLGEGVTFEHITHLKISDYPAHHFQSILEDIDFLKMSKTATKLQSLQLTGTRSISTAAVLGLAQASHETIRLLRHRPQSRHTDSIWSGINDHSCDQIAALSKLRDLDVSLPSICHSLFARGKARWTGMCFIRFEDFCSSRHECAKPGLATSLIEILAAARCLMTERLRCKTELSIELSWCVYIFDPWNRTVSRQHPLDEEMTKTRFFERVDGCFRLATTSLDSGNKSPTSTITESDFLQAIQDEDR
jgi:hypothetical protein